MVPGYRGLFHSLVAIYSSRARSKTWLYMVYYINEYSILLPLLQRKL
jgi:hypothetical protein